MLTVFAKPNRRFRTENVGLRFWMDFLALQTLHNRPNESCGDQDLVSLHLTLIFENVAPLEGFEDTLIQKPDAAGDCLSIVTPEPMTSAIIDTRFQAGEHSGALADVERAFDISDLNVAISWNERCGPDFALFCDWLGGKANSRPPSFWLDQCPDVSLVRRVP